MASKPVADKDKADFKSVTEKYKINLKRCEYIENRF